MTPLAIPDCNGGFGYAFNAPPSPTCPQCRGEGQPDLFIADTTKLSADQRRLIERVKIAKDGSMEIRFRNQSDALTKAGQMLGGFKQTVVLQNPDGSAVNTTPAVVTMTPEQAQEAYMKWMNGEQPK
jgi:phage terminase small subunit